VRQNYEVVSVNIGIFEEPFSSENYYEDESDNSDENHSTDSEEEKMN